MFGKRLEGTPKSKCLELFFYVALFYPYCPWKFQLLSLVGFLNFVFSTQQGCWALLGFLLTALRSRNCLQQKVRGRTTGLTLLFSFPQGSLSWAACCPISANSCFIYFVLFYGCLQKKDKFYTGDSFTDKSLFIHFFTGSNVKFIHIGQILLTSMTSPTGFQSQNGKPVAFFQSTLSCLGKWLQWCSQWKAKQTKDSGNQMVLKNFLHRGDRKPRG